MIKIEQQRRWLPVFLIGAAHLVGNLSAVAWNVAAVRSTDIHSFSVLSYITSWSLLLQVVVSLGMSQVVVRFGSGHVGAREEIRQLYGMGLALPLAAGFVLVSVLLATNGLLGRWQSNYSLEAAMIAVSAGTSMAIVAVLAAMYQSQGRPGIGAVFNNAMLPVLLLASFLVAPRLCRGFNVLHIFALPHIVLGILAVILIFRRAKFSWSYALGAKEYLAFGMRALSIGIVYLGLSHLDRIMLGSMGRMDEVGLYNISARMVRIMLAVVYLFPPLVGPLFARHIACGDSRPAFAAYAEATRVIARLTIPLAVVMLIDGSRLLMLVVGPGCGSETTVLQVLTIGVLVVALAGPNGLLLQMGGRERDELRLSVLALVLNLIMDILLIPQAGALGAALATALSYCVVTLLKVLLCHHIWRVWPATLTDRGLLLPLVVMILVHVVMTYLYGSNLGIVVPISLAAFVVVSRPWRPLAGLMSVWTKSHGCVVR